MHQYNIIIINRLIFKDYLRKNRQKKRQRNTKIQLYKVMMISVFIVPRRGVPSRQELSKVTAAFFQDDAVFQRRQGKVSRYRKWYELGTCLPVTLIEKAKKKWSYVASTCEIKIYVRGKGEERKVAKRSFSFYYRVGEAVDKHRKR